MSLDTVKIGTVSVSRLIIGGNTFSGFSHFGSQKDWEMRRYFTAARIKETLAEAERLRINTHIGRIDEHICCLLLEYWDDGGKIQWFAQTDPDVCSPKTFDSFSDTLTPPRKNLRPEDH